MRACKARRAWHVKTVTVYFSSMKCKEIKFESVTGKRISDKNEETPWDSIFAAIVQNCIFLLAV